MSRGGPWPWPWPWRRRGWGGLRGAAAGLALALALVLLGLACLVLRGPGPSAALLGAAGAWCALRPAGGRRPGPRTAKAAANGGLPMGSRLGQPEARAGAALPSPTCRPSFGNHLTPPTRFVQTLRRRYPIQQAQYASLGALPTVCWDGFQKKSVLSARNSSMVQSPVTVKIAPPDSNLSHSPILEQLISPVALSSNSTLDPCAKETVLSALKESRKRAVEEEDDQTFPIEQENKRRRHDSSGSGQSAFEPLVANGAPASLVPKPGSLKRGLTSQCLDECLNKRSRSSSISSMNNMYTGGIPSSIRNAIASSYSSTRGLSQVWKRSGLSTSPLSSPASSRSQTPERPLKKAREEEPHRSSTSTPVKSDMELQTERAVETPVQKKQSSLSLPSLSESSGKRKRKIQLLSSRRGDQLALPPPPQLSFPVTVEDLDAEKKAVLKCFNKVLEDKTDSPATSSAETIPASKPLSFTLMSTGPTSVLTAPLVASTGSLLESLKKMQNSQSIPVLSDSTGVAATSQPVPAAPLLSASSVPLNSGSLSVTASDSKLVPVLNLPVPLAPPCSLVQPGSSESSLGVPTSLELGPTPSKPPSSPKPSILFGMLSIPPASQPAAATATSSTPITTAPVFKPIFGTLPKSENMVPSAAGTSTTVTVSSSATSLSATSPASTTMFKPVFGSLTTSGPPATASPFAFKQASQLASTADVTTASTTTPPVFASFPNSIFTTAATTSTVLSTITECTTKPMFSFGLNLPSSTSVSASPAVSTATSTSASQPFLFGAPSSSVPSTEAGFASTGPVFGFGQPAVTTATTTTNVPVGSTFGQAPLNVAQATPSTITTTTTTGFSIFGSTALTSSTPATAGQSTLSFGSSLTPFCSFGTGAKPPPAYSGAASQPAFGTGTPDSQQSANKPTTGPASFSAPFSFGASTTQSTAQPAFGSNTQPAFGANSQASFGTSSSQPAFGGTTSIFSFGTATTTTTSSFGSNTQTTNSGARGMVFGSATSSPFTFGASTQQSTGPSAFGIGTPSLGGSTPAVAFNFGAGQSGSAGAITLFGSPLTQNTLGAQNQSTSFAFSAAGTPDNKPVFGGTAAPSFGQSTPVPGAAGGGSNSLSFGTPSTPASGFGSVGPSFAPSFSIGSGSKTGARQRLQARRQHTRKK